MKKTVFYILYISLCVAPIALMVSFFGLVFVTYKSFQQPEYRSGKHDAPWISNAHYVYYRGVAKVFQSNPDCSIYDEKFLYQPSSGCSFNNLDFSTTLSFDLNGRKNPDRLNHRSANPIFILGDSEAMGWGVNDNETFAYILERDFNYPFYNLGVSSYGTVREIISGLEHPAFKNASCIIIQYNSNDKWENSTFLANGELPQPTRTRFEQMQNVGKQQKVTVLFVMRKTLQYLLKHPEQVFWPFKNVGENMFGGRLSLSNYIQRLTNLFNMSEEIVQLQKSEDVNETAEDFMDEAESSVFIDVLKKFPLLSNKTILVIGQSGFVSDLTSNPNLPSNVIPLDWKLSAKEHRFVIDGHPNIAGHKKIASSIATAIAENTRLKENCAVR